MRSQIPASPRNNYLHNDSARLFLHEILPGAGMPDGPEGFVDWMTAAQRLAFHNIDRLMDVLSQLAFPDFPECVLLQISQCEFRQSPGLAAVIDQPVCLDNRKEISIAFLICAPRSETRSLHKELRPVNSSRLSVNCGARDYLARNRFLMLPPDLRLAS